jgi:hypothetical protein
MMRATVALLLSSLATLSAACAATPEEAYIAARDAVIAEVRGQKTEDAQVAINKQREGELLDRLRPLVGTPPSGFSGPGVLSPETLLDEMGSTALDGVLYATPDGNSQVVATTPDLLRLWLNQYGGAKKDDLAAGLADDPFTQAIDTDAHLDQIASLPIRLPSGARIAWAWIAQYEQDFRSDPPDKIAIALVTPTHAFLGIIAMSQPMDRIAACDALLKSGRAKAKAAQDNDARMRLNDEADANFYACWQDRAKTAPEFGRLVEQAQALADDLARH